MTLGRCNAAVIRIEGLEKEAGTLGIFCGCFFAYAQVLQKSAHNVRVSICIISNHVVTCKLFCIF